MVRPPSQSDRGTFLLTPTTRRRLVERQILEAMERGEFDDLPGEGKPLPVDALPARDDELRWTVRVMRRADVVPDEVRYRRRIDELLLHMDVAKVERQVISAVRELGRHLHRPGRMGSTIGPRS